MTRIRVKTKLYFALVMSLLVMTLPILGCAGEPVGQSGGSLRIAASADSVTLDPALLITNPDIWLTGNIYDKLIEKNEDMSLKPELAVSWEPNEDITAWTIKLRQGVTFHSGKAFTAEDVAFTFNRLLDPDIASPGRSSLTAIENIVTVDDYTVRFELDAPNAFFPDTSLTIYQSRILSASVDTSQLTTQADGTGPFILEDFITGERAVLSKNPNYWNEGRPYLDEVIFYYMPGAESRIEALKTGSVDAVYPLGPVEALSLEGVPGIKISEIASASYLVIVMDTAQEPFNNKKVRQAFQAATDREAIRTVAMQGRGALGADIQIAPTDPLASPEMKVPAYDVERAKQLLEEAGYADGIDVTLHTSDVVPGHVEMAVAFKESAAPAGIRVNIMRQSEEIYWSKIWLNESFMTVNWMGRHPDGALSIVMLSDAPWNEANYQNPVFDALVLKARTQANFEDQRQTYLEIYKILVDEVPRIIPVFTPILMGLSDDVFGLEAHAGQFLLLENAWLER